MGLPETDYGDDWVVEILHNKTTPSYGYAVAGRCDFSFFILHC